jgi:hypothetical protein
LLEPLAEDERRAIRDKKARRELQCRRALETFDAWRTGHAQNSLAARAQVV